MVCEMVSGPPLRNRQAMSDITPPSIARRRTACGLVALDSRRRASTGSVWLVGAGPGDPDLLTVKALNVLRIADVVVHDGLVSDAILDLVPAATRRINVVKRKSRHSYPQPEIERMLVAFALEGLTVVRLKGGDPFVFGRGGEELEACRAAGIDCHVVPGISSALAAAASAGAPLTHRGAAQAVIFVTGHAKAGETPDLDWVSLARPNQTVVIYMGVSNAASIAARLVEAGRSPLHTGADRRKRQPPDERRALVTLAELGEAAKSFSGPALLMIGEAMALASSSERGLPARILEEGGLGARAPGIAL